MPTSSKPRRKVTTDEWQEYSHQPTIRQKRFPERRTVTRSARHVSFEPTSYQSTLTQANFVSTPSFELEEDDYVSDDIESDGGRATKRRKVTKKKPSKSKKTLRRQSTLTQMPFFNQPSSELDVLAYDSDELSDFDEQSAVKSEGDVEDEEDDEVQEEEEIQLTNYVDTQVQQPTQPFQLIRGYDPADQDWEGYQEGMQMSLKIKPEPMSTQSPIRADPAAPQFKTPQKPMKMEIPSSQSPAATPLTLSQLTPQRSPLKELTANSVAQRDNTPTKRRLSQSVTLVDEPENIDPDTTVKLPQSQALLTPKEEHSDSFHYLPNPSPSPTKRLENRPRTTPPTTNRSNSRHTFVRPRQRSAIINDSQEESQFTAYYTPSSSPVRTAAVRSSQATTVDLTQPPASMARRLPARVSSPAARFAPAIPTSSPVPPITPADVTVMATSTARPMFRSSQLSEPPPVPPFSSSLPLPPLAVEIDNDSQIQRFSDAEQEHVGKERRWGSISSLQNSADIKTVSQLVGSISWGTQTQLYGPELEHELELTMAHDD